MNTGVIVNPLGCRGNALPSWRELESRLCQQYQFDVCLTERAGHGTELVRDLAEQGFRRVIAYGGDGTLNEVVNGAMGTDLEVGLIPAGTGNDWARTVGIPKDQSAAAEIAFNGKAKQIDVGECLGNKFFLNIAGAGFDAVVAKRIGEAKGGLAALPPSARYFWCVLSTFMSYKGAEVQVQLDGEKAIINDLTLFAVANAKYYGSGMKIAPGVEPDDGLFEVVWGSGVSRLELPGLLKQVYSGDHVDHPKVQVKRAKEVELWSELPVPVHIDGDVCGELPARFKIHPGALSFVKPD